MLHDPTTKVLHQSQTVGPFLRRTSIAYFSMEMALQTEMHTYSGGLGVLAGDTARSCADLELPIVFVTLVSRQGYLRQDFDGAGLQRDEADPWRVEDFATPLSAMVAVSIGERQVWVKPWLHVMSSPLGHAVPVVLLDTDLEENHPDDRTITDRLYGGDAEYRLKQEIVLGIGGRRLLGALGFVNIRTHHLNEGHAALPALDLLSHYPLPADQVHDGEVAYDVGRVRDMCIFTTHTPIDAGHDRFDYGLVQKLLPNFADIVQLRLLAGADALNMTMLALKLSGYVNGVALRHAETTRLMFPGYRIRAVTNGVHLPTWAHPAFGALYSKHFPVWGHEPEVLALADQIPPDAVWGAHERAKRDLIEMVAERTGMKLDPAKPIVGYARRMTSYKRPELLFTDLDALRRINERLPFQIVLAGKAHPQDEPGKRQIQHIHRHVAALRDALPAAFVSNYDLDVAKALVSGVDVWLNTPMPPMEASGTSGMKAALNGVLNLSVLDGWWLEACVEGVTGWAIGHDGGEGAAEATAEDLYYKLSNTVLPLYHQDRDGWIRMMQSSICKLAPFFNTQRMMRRYAAEAYVR